MSQVAKAVPEAVNNILALTQSFNRLSLLLIFMALLLITVVPVVMHLAYPLPPRLARVVQNHRKR
jgi:cytochrome c oxidase subunit IV